MWLLLVTTVITGAVLYKILFLSGNDFWKKHGIREIDTSPALGILDILLGRKTMTEADGYAYRQMGSTDKFCGIVQMGKPMLIVKDMELLKKVLIKDFDHFVDRRKMFHKEDGTLEKLLFNLEGDEWKGVRSSISPTFTTGKIRRMMHFFNSVGKEWAEEYMRKAKSNPKGSVVIDLHNSVNQYTVEVISNTAFGMSAGVIKNPDCTFIKMANRITDMNAKQIMKFGLKFLLPSLSRLLGLTLFDSAAISYFEEILVRELKARMNGESKRNDFLQLLVEAKKGELKATGSDELSNFEKEAQISVTDSQNKQYLTDENMNAQCVVFFLAGYFSTSSTITFILYALAIHQEVQDRLREEVNKIIKDDGSLDYDDVGQMIYMDMVVCEILRITGASTRLERMCVKDYKDPDSGLVIPKGTLIGIPANGFHNDRQYYDNPEKFDPEHFSPEKKTTRNPYAFMPFGLGPRNCIGMRFALTEVKAAVAHIMHNFAIGPTPNTPTPFQGKPAGMLVCQNLEVRLTPIDKK